MVFHLCDSHICKAEGEKDHYEFKANPGYRKKKFLKDSKNFKDKKKKIH